MTDKPIRIQRKRVKGWRMPENTVYVGRGSKWGNPYRIGAFGPDGKPMSAVKAIRRFAEEVSRRGNVSELRGKNLACWCGLDQPCHADVLLELANK